MKVVSEKDFKAESEKGLVLIDFYADWCGPCRMMGPIFEEISNELGAKVNCFKVNVDDSEKIARKFGVMSIPTFILLENGEVREKHIGLWQKDDALDLIKSYL